MAKPHATSTPTTAPGLSRRKVLWIALGALLLAALPHFFLNMPVEFYKQGNIRAWLGLSIWSPSFLAAVALFCGVDAGTRRETPLIKNVDIRAVAAIATPIIVLVSLCYLYFDGYQRVGAWSELGLAMVLYAGTFAIGCFFWQGFVQHYLRPAAPASALKRVLHASWVAIAACALWLPFLVNYPYAELTPILNGLILVYLGIALLYEFGVSVFGCIFVAALMGVAWAWAHQMTFY